MDRLDPKQLAAVHRICEHDSDMIPAVSGDSLYAANAVSETYRPPVAGISVRDFVLNMEAIGATFTLIAYTDAMYLLSSVSIPSENPVWRQREQELCDAFCPASKSRAQLIMDFLVERGDVPHRTGCPAPNRSLIGGVA